MATTNHTRISLGQRGETLAVEHLTASGYQVRQRNYRCRVGEIDAIAQKDGIWVFVEVRTRRGNKFGTPEESVTRRKKQHLRDAAQTYLQEHELSEVEWRIDFVAVELSAKGELLRIDVIENAVTNDE